jgi:hypothetical protein
LAPAGRMDRLPLGLVVLVIAASLSLAAEAPLRIPVRVTVYVFVSHGHGARNSPSTRRGCPGPGAWRLGARLAWSHRYWGARASLWLSGLWLLTQLMAGYYCQVIQVRSCLLLPSWAHSPAKDKGRGAKLVRNR